MDDAFAPLRDASAALQQKVLSMPRLLFAHSMVSEFENDSCVLLHWRCSDACAQVRRAAAKGGAGGRVLGTGTAKGKGS